jgi:hypothetical protein
MTPMQGPQRAIPRDIKNARYRYTMREGPFYRYTVYRNSVHK